MISRDHFRLSTYHNCCSGLENFVLFPLFRKKECEVCQNSCQCVWGIKYVIGECQIHGAKRTESNYQSPIGSPFEIDYASTNQNLLYQIPEASGINKELFGDSSKGLAIEDAPLNLDNDIEFQQKLSIFCKA